MSDTPQPSAFKNLTEEELMDPESPKIQLMKKALLEEDPERMAAILRT